MKSKRTPTNFEAFLPIIVMALMVLVGNIIMGIRLEFLLIIASIFSAIIAIRVGISWDEMMKAYTKKFSDAFPAILILIAIGGVVGTWMFSGTVPMMIYYGLKFLNPKFVVVTAFVVTALVST
ncbi:MAG: Na+/H+ antiporter NhaC, partial [Cetobacterium sp.]